MHPYQHKKPGYVLLNSGVSAGTVHFSGSDDTQTALVRQINMSCEPIVEVEDHESSVRPTSTGLTHSSRQNRYRSSHAAAGVGADDALSAPKRHQIRSALNAFAANARTSHLAMPPRSCFRQSETVERWRKPTSILSTSIVCPGSVNASRLRHAPDHYFLVRRAHWVARGHRVCIVETTQAGDALPKAGLDSLGWKLPPATGTAPFTAPPNAQKSR